MAPRWLEADVEILYLVARLRNEWYSSKPTVALADAIARQETRVGLDLMGRKRFEWRIQGPQRDSEAPKPDRRPPMISGEDPRKILKVVS
jgi:hypothetical protein